MHHRLLDKPISPLVAFLAIAVLGGIATALIVRTIDTAGFLASQTFETEAL